MELLGKNDLRLYSECTVLGLKNYPVFYEKRGDRTPVMLGFNLPAFKILDVFSIEVEYLKNPWINSVRIPRWDNRPLPLFVKSEGFEHYTKSAYPYTRDDWKWSVFIQKDFPGYSIYGQVANDHLRPITKDVNPINTEITNDTNDWYFMLKLQANF